jgi:hypothetical protein
MPPRPLASVTIPLLSAALALSACTQAGPLDPPGFARKTAAVTAPLVGPHTPQVRKDPTHAVVLQLPWGQAPGQVGHHRGEENMPEGPMALDVAADGRLAVLDQVNGRVQLFAPGQPVQILPLPRDSFQDVAFDDAGRLYALDRHGLAEVIALTGGALQLPTIGDGVDEGGAVTGLFPMRDGLWVEAEHDTLVHLADAEGHALAERQQLRGRFGQDGKHLVRAEVQGGHQVRVEVSDAVGRTFATHLDFAWRLDGIRELALDAQGQTVVVVALARDERDRTVESRLTAVVLDAAGQELRRTELSPPTQPEEQFRPIRLGPDGALYVLQCGAQGAEVVKVQP